VPDLKKTGIAFLLCLSLYLPLFSEENDIRELLGTIERESLEAFTETTETNEIAAADGAARIRTQYYSAEAVQALPRLKALANQEPEFNKIIFRLEGYPKNKEIILEIKRLASPAPESYEKMVSFTIQNDGAMLITGSDQQIQAVIGNSRGFLPGEKVYYRFRTVDGEVDKEVWGIPTPAIVRDKDHQVVLKAELVSVMPTVYQISFPKMNEGEEYELKSTSVGNVVRSKPKYHKEKPLLYSPVAGGNSKGGEAILEIRRKAGPTYSIRLPWGCALEGYRSGKKTYSSKV